MALQNKNMDLNPDSEDDHSQSTLNGSGNGNGESDKYLAIAKRETAVVNWFRLALLVVLAASIAGVGYGVFTYINTAEQQEFEEQFHADANKVFESMGNSLDVTIGAVDAFVVSIISFARYTNATWPFVTIPDFAVRAAKIRDLSNAVLLSLYPVVTHENKDAWENYTKVNNAWVNESIVIQEGDKNFQGEIVYPSYVLDYIHGDAELPFEGSEERDLYFPAWQTAPAIPIWAPYNWDILAIDDIRVFESIFDSHRVQISQAYHLPDPNDPVAVERTEVDVDYFSDFVAPDQDPSEPASDIYYPILDTIDAVTAENPKNEDFVAFVSMSIFWRNMIENILPPGSDGVVIVFENDCNPTFTFQIFGPEVVYLGRGDLHDADYDHMVLSAWLNDLDSFSSSGSTYSGVPIDRDFCPFHLRLYPSQVMEDEYRTNDPVIFTIIVVVIFVFTSVIFICYDQMVEYRQRKVMQTAVKSSAIVSSLFPQVVHDRIMGIEADEPRKKKANAFNSGENTNFKLQSFLRNPGGAQPDGDSDPIIADLFTETTVIFADIAGFTAWSSLREPAMVFKLLETLYAAFDKCAKKRGVFKVETIGDSYVAVTGCPSPRKDHAVVMARFALDCSQKMMSLTRQLEASLGPDTGDLGLRIGLNSGPCTAGVLRGERARFQLFGNTVNVAARMESNGMRDRIQASQTTADYLISAGKEHWVKAREDLVEAKGKGKMQTYWINPKNNAGASIGHILGSDSGDESESGNKDDRLIDWNTTVLAQLLQQIVARRKHSSSPSPPSKHMIEIDDGNVLEEFKETIDFPEFIDGKELADTMNLDSVVIFQLREFVASIADLYTSVPFHAFAHATHVTMSMVNMFSHVVAPTPDVAHAVERTHSIVSDPLAKFACLFAALIHDVDHPGVPNGQLVKENQDIASVYKGKSIAEQNSMDCAWHLFTSSAFDELRHTLCETDEEMHLFRQMVVNLVIATDLFDNDLIKVREDRWHQVVGVSDSSKDPSHFNRKATMSLELMMQASDIGHVMQHWIIYRKWSTRLFEEMYGAFLAGRSEKDPSDGWYEGELWFFDNHAIPLAKKLIGLGVLGASSNEYLTCAEKNREEWAERGHEEVEIMKENALREDAEIGGLILHLSQANSMNFEL